MRTPAPVRAICLPLGKDVWEYCRRGPEGVQQRLPVQ